MNTKLTRFTLSLPFILGLLAMTTSLSTDMLVPAINQISVDFFVGLPRAENVISAFLAGFSVSQLIFGPATDAMGRRPVLICGIVLFLIANFFATLTSQIFGLLFFRMIQGFGAAAISVVINATLRDCYTKNALSRMISLVTLVMTIAPLIGPTLGGYLVLNFGWRAIPWVCSAFSVVCLSVVLIGLPETLKLEQRRSIQWRLVLTNYWEIIKQPRARGFILISSFSFSAMFAFITLSADLYINQFHISTEHFGFFYAFNIVIMFLMSTVNSKIVSIIGYHKMLLIGISIQIIATILLGVNIVMGLGLVTLVVAIALFVGCVPLICSNCMAGMLSDLPNLAGTASALAGGIRFGLAALAGLFVSVLLTTSLIAMLIVMAGCVVMMVYSYGLIKTRQVNQLESIV